MKKNVAIVWGGYSSEQVVSEKSMKGILSFMDSAKYNLYAIKIERDAWTSQIDGEQCNVDKNDFSIIAPTGKIKIDFAYITIHGTPGEDGRLQGYLDMIGIPYSTAGIMSAVLTFNKYMCNRYLEAHGVQVAKSVLLRKGDAYLPEDIVTKLSLPVFVKPNVGGSSFATTKVKTTEDLRAAIDAAFVEGVEVIVESFIAGREVTCGCYKTDKETVLPITEAISKNEFFDYQAKYEGAVEEVTPARIGDELTKLIQETTSRIYDLVGVKGIARADYIISDGVPYFLEINTTPGMTPTSFIPQQVAAAGMNMRDVFTEIIEHEYKRYV